MTGRFIAVVGPSGVGKDSVMAGLAAQAQCLTLAQRVITRPAAAGGEEFEGVSEAVFAAREAAGAFALSWQAHELSYGIPIQIETALAQGKDVLANLSRAVLPAARARYSNCEVLALSADPAVLRERLHGRGRESQSDIERRLARKVSPLPDSMIVHIVDNSGALDHAVQIALTALYPNGLQRRG